MHAKLVDCHQEGVRCTAGPCRRTEGVEVHIDNDEWRDEGRPFTPTSLPDDRLLEFTTKRYPDGDGMTMALHALQPGAQLKLSDAFGSITYKGPGTFIAAGTA
ncbi:hypothetical protein [Halochromatium salexigens]|uniref:Uncharacterized protein n=1 Tax=Halochromatium salexigens TaxID=49447 RepID=A0AAJ0UHA1_HALSE|nr:hypothetical protein [Halochromatium salexigens]MBK5931467.1 hypothetical protein [Halochromatium salexigens]